MRALADNDPRSLLRAQATNVSETLLSDNDVEVVLGLVDVSGHWDDARDSVRVDLRGACGWRVHDGVLAVSQEISRATETVQHARAHDTGGVGVGVYVDLDGGVHADDAETLDDLGRVGDLLRAEEELVEVMLPVVVEALEAIWREADGGCGGEIKLAGVEEVEERVLEDFGPDGQVLEVGVGETTDDGVGNVADSGLQWKKVGREAAVLDFMLEELDKMAGNGLGSVVGWGIWRGLILVVRFDDGDNLLSVNWDVGRSDAVFWCHNEIWLAVWWEIHCRDIVETFERRHRCVDFHNDLTYVSKRTVRLLIASRQACAFQ